MTRRDDLAVVGGLRMGDRGAVPEAVVEKVAWALDTRTADSPQRARRLSDGDLWVEGRLSKVLASLSGRLAKYKIPKSVVLADELPRTASGKLLKSRVRTRYGNS